MTPLHEGKIHPRLPSAGFQPEIEKTGNYRKSQQKGLEIKQQVGIPVGRWHWA